MEKEYNKIYARTNENGIVVHFFSEAFEQPQTTDFLIDGTNTERHGAQKYQVYDEDGFYNYEIKNGILIVRDKTQDKIQRQFDDYNDDINNLIRARYTVSQEFAILRQKDIKPEEFAEYNAFCEECKRQVKEKLPNGR